MSQGLIIAKPVRNLKGIGLRGREETEGRKGHQGAFQADGKAVLLGVSHLLLSSVLLCPNLSSQNQYPKASVKMKDKEVVLYKITLKDVVTWSMKLERLKNNEMSGTILVKSIT